MPGKAFPNPKRLLCKTSLREAWDKAKKDGKRFSSYGTDGKSGEEFSANLDDNLTNVAKALSSGQYQFSDLRCRWIDKSGDNHKQRLICIPTVSDRLVQRTIADILEKTDRLGVKNNVSFGFQRNLGVANAVMRALEYRNSGSRWAVKTDVISFFDRINRAELLSRIHRHIPSSLFPLISQVVRCEVRAKSSSDKEKLRLNGISVGRGLRQGMPLSPLLSNFELRSFDRRAVASKLKMVRYADDIIVFCDSKNEAELILSNLTEWLEELGHSLPTLEEKKKTFIVPPTQGVEFLGLDISYSTATARYELVLSERVVKNILLKTRRMSTVANCQQEKWDFAGYVKGMKSRNASLASTYRNAINVDDFKHRLQIATNDSTRELLKDLFGTEAIARISDDKLRFLGVIEPLSKKR
jgi:RNA-directed DNA polymerase